MMFTRANGILLHPTSLPGPHGIGEFGPPVLARLDRLQRMGQRLWLVLPLGPPATAIRPIKAHRPSIAIWFSTHAGFCW
jgi:4-alpha-glucanotransferase